MKNIGYSYIFRVGKMFVYFRYYDSLDYGNSDNNYDKYCQSNGIVADCVAEEFFNH